jgi:hypothetical protein
MYCSGLWTMLISSPVLHLRTAEVLILPFFNNFLSLKCCRVLCTYWQIFFANTFICQITRGHALKNQHQYYSYIYSYCNFLSFIVLLVFLEIANHNC